MVFAHFNWNLNLSYDRMHHVCNMCFKVSIIWFQVISYSRIVFVNLSKYVVKESLRKMHKSNDRMLCDLIIWYNALKSSNMGHVIEYCYLTSHSIFCRPRTAQIMEEQISKCMPYHYYHHHYTIVVQFYATIIG